MTPEKRKEIEEKYQNHLKKLYIEGALLDLSADGEQRFYAEWRFLKALRKALLVDEQEEPRL
jgi:hypothetical protein